MSEFGPENFPPIRIAVTGGRDMTDRRMIDRGLSALAGVRTIGALAHGDSRGADKLSDEWAKSHGIERKPYPADWRALGKSAGPIRNRRMLDDFKPELLVVFPGGRGTADCRSAAAERGIPVLTVDYHPVAPNGYRLSGEIP